jgi:hypothetical protein
VTWLETPLDAEFSAIRQRRADAGLSRSLQQVLVDTAMEESFDQQQPGNFSLGGS